MVSDSMDLQEIVTQHGPLSYRAAANCTRQVANGLAAMHRRNLIHRDIKPANLLVHHAGTVEILDSELAQFMDESAGAMPAEYAEKAVGTVDYMAPEQAIDSHKIDLRVDLYSLGCTLYFMLTGHAPFPDGTIPRRLMQHQAAKPADIRKKRSDAPEALIAICKKLMAKSPDDRYQTAGEVSDALALLLENGGLPGI